MSLLNDESRPNTPGSSAITGATGAGAAANNTSNKADQIAQRFFIKFLLILVSARSTALENGPRSQRIDKWFNLETPDTDIHREHMRNFRALSTLNVLPTLTLNVVLTVPELGTNRALVAVDALNTRLRIEPTPRGGVLLESWTITATPPTSSSSNSTSTSNSLSSSESAEVSLSAVYKHAISLFRSIYTLTHTLPSSKLYQRYRQHPSLPTTSSEFAIELRLAVDRTILTFDASPSPTRPTPLQASTHAFPALSTPLGSLKLAVRYLTRPNFRIDTIESLISSRLFNQDAGVDESLIAFTPTVLAHRARDSAAASGGAASGRGGAGGEGLDVGSTAMAIRPLLPQRHTRTISFPVAGSTSGVPARPAGYGQSQDRGGDREYSASASERSANAPHLVPSSSPRYPQFRTDNLAFAVPGSLGPTSGMGGRNSTSTSTSPPPAVSNLTRLHLQMGAGGVLASTTANSSTGTGSSEGTVRARPPPTPISAFKSSTFASSASGLNSPSSSLRGGGIGTPSGISRPPSSLPHAIPERKASGNTGVAWPSTSTSPPNSATGIHFPTSDIPPPFATSSSLPRTSGLGYGLPPRISGSAGNTPPNVGTGVSGSAGKAKRYSSSFHRRAPSAGGSASVDLSGTGTPSGGKRLSGGVGRGGSPLALLSDLPTERSRRSSNLLDPTENEEDLSEFIRAIDDTRQRGGSGLNTSRSSDSNSSSAAIGVQGHGHARRVSLAERRQSPLIGRLDLAPAPPSPRSPPARLQELNLFESDEREPAAPIAFVAPTTLPTTLNNAGVGTPQLDLGSKLQNMDDTFKKTYQGLKERRRGISRVDPPTSSAATSSSAAPNSNDNDPGGNHTRRMITGPSFRGRGSGGALGGAIANETELAPTPGEASDGSGYAGIFGRMDMDSSEARPPFGRYDALRRQSATQTYTVAEGGGLPFTGGDGSGGSGPATSGVGLSSIGMDPERGADDGDREDDRERRHREYEGDNEGGQHRERERVSRYTSVLRRDGTVRAGDLGRPTSTSTSTSSGSAPLNDPTSRPRRPAMGWPGSSSPPP